MVTNHSIRCEFFLQTLNEDFLCCCETILARIMALKKANKWKIFCPHIHNLLVRCIYEKYCFIPGVYKQVRYILITFCVKQIYQLN